MLRILFIGGTGNISTAVSRLCVEKGFSLTLLTRGTQERAVPGAEMLPCDICDPESVRAAVGGRTWDVVVNWIAFRPEEVKRDIGLFSGKTEQYIFISSASVYQKPSSSYFITESTPLSNPYWEYSRNKIACEEALAAAHRESGFPCTIVRPSHTYDTVIPVAIGGFREYTAVDRIKRGLPVISHGDGTSLWVLTHSEDFAKGFTGLFADPRAVGQAYHITSDEVLTWDQIYRTIGQAVGREPVLVHVSSDFIGAVHPPLGAELKGDKAWSVVFDNSKIKSLVPSFVCTVPFAVGIRRTISWFEADPRRIKVAPETNALIDRILRAFEAQTGGPGSSRSRK